MGSFEDGMPTLDCSMCRPGGIGAARTFVSSLGFDDDEWDAATINSSAAF